MFLNICRFVPMFDLSCVTDTLLLLCRKRLFGMINDLPTIFEVVSGKSKAKPPSANNHSNSKSKSSNKTVRPILLNCTHTMHDSCLCDQSQTPIHHANPS
jgi:hypothetical protein